MHAGHDGPSTLDEPTVLAWPDPTEQIDALMRDLRASPAGLATLDAERRLDRYGRNELTRRSRHGWIATALRQLTHPLAILLWAAAALAFIAGLAPIGIAVVVVILLNAVFAFIQEQQAERAVEALAAYLPTRAIVLRDGKRISIEATELVPGDVLLVAEGDRISADCRLLEGSIEVDISALTGESVTVERDAVAVDSSAQLLEARELIFSGTTCTGGEARALVFATGMHTELGRIAALSERVESGESPLERQIRRLAWLIAAIAVVMSLAFIPIATLGADLPMDDAIMLAIGLLVGNVPEGLLPVITLALAVAVRDLARSGALVKRLSAVETLGSTTVICTDKTGTLTENRMRVTDFWTADGAHSLAASQQAQPTDSTLARMLESMVDCCDAEPPATPGGQSLGDPTELAMLDAAALLGIEVSSGSRRRRRRREFRFDPRLKLMSAVNERGGAIVVDVKGAPEAVLPRCDSVLSQGARQSLDPDQIEAAVKDLAQQGLRVLAVATKHFDDMPDSSAITALGRANAESNLCLLGLVAMLDPPRAEVAAAVDDCHRAGIRIHVVTGDHALTARAIARKVGIAVRGDIVLGDELDRMTDAELRALLATDRELIFSRSSPEAKLRIADALDDLEEVVAMTGDGVNDAPALRAADIGVAMGASGTDVAREASTIVLTDDNFANIAAAIRGGRRVYDNIRKFLFYILAHTTPEVVPFVAFGLAGGSLPLPLTVLQLLAFDVGTEIFPALALGREPAEPGLMDRSPRKRGEHVIDARMLGRAWLYLGTIAAALSLATFLWVLTRSGWNPGDDVSSGSPLHEDYVRATTMTFLSMVVCQVGTAFVARSDHASLREIGFFSNPMLIWGVLFSIAFALAIAYLPPLQALIGTATPKPEELLVILPFPLIIWAADEVRRRLANRRRALGEVSVA